MKEKMSERNSFNVCHQTLQYFCSNVHTYFQRNELVILSKFCLANSCMLKLTNSINT